MEKIIEITEYLCEPEVMKLEEFLQASTIDSLGVPLDPYDESGDIWHESQAQIEQLKNLDIDKTMEFGESEAGLTIKRIS